MSTYRVFEVVVVDNGSKDGSLQAIRSLVQGKISFPIHYVAHPDNDGFGAGCNVGLRFAIAQGNGLYFWILNNDTLPRPGALIALVQAAEKDRVAGARVGQYGSKLLYMDRPDTIQSMGGRYYSWWGVTQEIGNRKRDGPQWNLPARQPDILVGASLFVTKPFLSDVGLLAEDYFIYYEEHDWTLRGRRRGWGLRLVPGSEVLHRQGASTGALGGDVAHKSVLSDFYSLRNRLLFTMRYTPWKLPTVYLSFLPSAFLRLRRGQWNRLPMMLKIMVAFWRKPVLRPPITNP
jgi:GT2 family glycosyltransferase